MGKEGKTKLRKPDIHKVDLVDDGANPGAKIMLFKSKSGPGAPTGAEPPEDNNEKNILKKLMDNIAAALGWDQEKVKKAMTECMEKGEPGRTSQTFDQKMVERRQRQIYSEIWDFTYALQETLEGILRDQTVAAGEKPDLLVGSLDQFITTIEAAIPIWCGGETVEKSLDGNEEDIKKAGRKISAERLQRMKSCMETLDKLIKEAEGEPEEPDPMKKCGTEPAAKNKNKEVPGMAKIDKSTLSADVLEYLTEVEKRATDAETERDTARQELQKMKDEHPSEEDIFKGMSPAARKIVEDLQKRADQAETSEYIAKAKGYEPLGVKADEFGPVLKEIAKKCPDQYTKVAEALEKAAAIAKTGEVFKEMGSAAAGATGTAEQRINKRVEEIAKRDSISVAKAWGKIETEDPDLLAEYRKEVRG